MKKIYIKNIKPGDFIIASLIDGETQYLVLVTETNPQAGHISGHFVVVRSYNGKKHNRRPDKTAPLGLFDHEYTLEKENKQ